MRNQQAVWQREHSNKTELPSMANTTPATGVVQFVEWLDRHNIELQGRAIDIGCGKGRNSIYLASTGLDIWGVDYIEAALTKAKELAANKGVSDECTFIEAAVDEPWQFDDDFFDVAIDSFSSIDIETRAGRETYRDEMFRTLRPGGYALVTVCSSEDEWERELIANHPGLEPNSTIWPESGKFQKDYSEDELRQFYDKFEICDLKTTTKPSFKLGRQGISTNLWLVVRKPASYKALST